MSPSLFTPIKQHPPNTPPPLYLALFFSIALITIWNAKDLLLSWCLCLSPAEFHEGRRLNAVQGCIFSALSRVWSTLVPGAKTLLFLGYSHDLQERQEGSSLTLRLSWKMQAVGLLHPDHLQKSCPSNSVLQHLLLLLGPQAAARDGEPSNPGIGDSSCPAVP